MLPLPLPGANHKPAPTPAKVQAESTPTPAPATGDIASAAVNAAQVATGVVNDTHAEEQVK